MSANRTLATYVGDMHALTAHVLEPFEKQLDLTKDVPVAHAVVVALVETCKQHIAVLEPRIQSLGNTEKIITDRIKTVVSQLFGYAAWMIDAVRPLAASKALRDSYTAIHLLMVGYVLLNTTATALGDEATQEIAEQFLQEWTRLADRVYSIIPQLTIKDLQADNVPVNHVNTAEDKASAERTLGAYVGDMHALTEHVLVPFERQLELTRDVPSAHSAVEALVATCRIHTPLLTVRLNEIGNSEKMITDKIKTAVAQMFGYAAGVIDITRPLAASKAVRDSYVAIHMLIVGYLMLSTTATSLEDKATQELASKNLKDWAENARLILRVIPKLAIKDLQDESIPLHVTDAESKVLDDSKSYAHLYKAPSSK